MIYHPLTSKGNNMQQFSFQDNGPEDKENRMKDIQVNQLQTNN